MICPGCRFGVVVAGASKGSANDRLGACVRVAGTSTANDKANESHSRSDYLQL